MSSFEVVDWVYANASGDSFKDRDELLKEINDLDFKKQLGPWLKGKWYNQVGKKSGVSLQTGLDAYQKDVEKEVSEVSKVIEKAEKQSDFDEIDLDEIEEEGGLEAREQAAELIKERAGEIKSLEEEVEEDISSEISSATSLEDLEEVDIGEAQTSRSASRLSSQLREKRNELEE